MQNKADQVHDLHADFHQNFHMTQKFRAVLALKTPLTLHAEPLIISLIL